MSDRDSIEWREGGPQRPPSSRKDRKDKGTKRSAWTITHCQSDGCHNFVVRRTSEIRSEVYCSRSCYRRNAFCGANGGRPNLPVGTRNERSDGYVVLKVGRGNKGWRLEHLVVMEEHLKRPLLPGENVHHKYGVKNDNRIEMLELWLVHQPKGQRVEDLIPWAALVLSRYAPEMLTEKGLSVGSKAEGEVGND